MHLISPLTLICATHSEPYSCNIVLNQAWQLTMKYYPTSWLGNVQKGSNPRTVGVSSVPTGEIGWLKGSLTCRASYMWITGVNVGLRKWWFSLGKWYHQTMGPSLQVSEADSFCGPVICDSLSPQMSWRCKAQFGSWGQHMTSCKHMLLSKHPSIGTDALRNFSKRTDTWTGESECLLQWSMNHEDMESMYCSYQAIESMTHGTFGQASLVSL